MEENKIRELIAKFMEGETSLDEERTIQQYFGNAGKLPADLEPYAGMFRYFSAGMPAEQGLMKEEESPCTGGKKRPHIRLAIWATGAAASIMIMLAVVWGTWNSGKTTAQLAPGTERPHSEATVAHEGNREHGLTAMSDTIERSTNNVDSIATSRQQKLRQQRRETIKYRFKPAPPETMMAKSNIRMEDSINLASQIMAQRELKSVEDRQQLAIGLIQAANIMRNEEILLMCSEEIY